VLPLDDRAEESLRCNDVNGTTAVQVLPISTDAFFENLWKAGLFQEINKCCGSVIDDYEEEFLEAAYIPTLAETVETLVQQTSQPDLKSFLVDLRKLADTALALKRPILFVL
jgi:hypothetical protein